MQHTRRRRRFIVDGHSAGGSVWALMKWQLTHRRAKWPRRLAIEEPSNPPPYAYGPKLVATWIGHSTVLLQTHGLNILTDPFLSPRASPFTLAGPKRVRPAALAADELPPIDVVLISHNHYDHLDLPGLRQLLKHHDPLFITPLGNKRYIRRARRNISCRELDWRQTAEIEGVRITVMPALHWSKRSFDDTNHGLWGAFVIETPTGAIYFAGDTGFGDGGHFKEVVERFGAPRLALLPIGAYEPRWFMKSQHMDPQDAVAAHQILGSKTSIAIHHATIQLTNEAIDAPARELGETLAAENIEARKFMVLAAGQSVILP